MKTPAPTRESPPRKRAADANATAAGGYVSPLKRVKAALAARTNKQLIDSVDDLKAFIRNNDASKSSVAATVMVKARVVWTTYEDCLTGPVTRLHLIDTQATETLEEMHATLRDNYKANKMQIDQELITASLYGVVKSTKGIPKDGDVITMRNVSRLKLFLGEACQLNTSLESIRVEADTAV